MFWRKLVQVHIGCRKLLKSYVKWLSVTVSAVSTQQATNSVHDPRKVAAVVAATFFTVVASTDALIGTGHLPSKACLCCDE